MPLVTDIFNTALERDVYHKTRDDVGAAFARVLINFDQGPIVTGEVVYPALYAVAWVLRAALLSVRAQRGDTAYRAALAVAMQLVTSLDPGDR